MSRRASRPLVHDPFGGDGEDLWHVRVDLIAPDDDGRRVSPVAEEPRRLLDEDERDAPERQPHDWLTLDTDALMVSVVGPGGIEPPTEGL